MRVARLVFSLGLLASVGGCGQPAPGPQGFSQGDVGVVLAEVGGLKVGASEFELAAARKAPSLGGEITPELRREILDELITEKALYLEARKLGVDLDPKVQKVVVNTLLREEVYSGVRNADFTEEQLRKYFEDHRDEFVLPEKLQIKRIFLKVDDDRTLEDALALAERLRGELGDDPAVRFKDVASEHSEDPYRRRGGDLGYVSREGKAGIDDAIIEAAFELEVGQLSEPFEAAGGVNLVFVSARRDSVERTYEQMKGSVLRRIKNDRYKELYAEYVETLRPRYQAVIHEEALDAVQLDARSRMSLMAPGRQPLQDLSEGMEDEE